jgi:AcrR family transcriptional regulator
MNYDGRRMAGRTYEQRVRAEEARRTRARIIEAGIRRLERAPAEPIAIEQLATEAGVARSTVYAIFGSRSGLFDAIARDLADRSGYERLLEAKHHPDARDYLRAGLRAASEMLAGDRDVQRALRSMDQLNHEAVGGAIERTEEERRNAMRRLARRLEEEGVLRNELSAMDAERILWVLTSFESFDALYTGCGMSLDATVTLLIEMAERLLYAEPYGE